MSRKNGFLDARTIDPSTQGPTPLRRIIYEVHEVRKMKLCPSIKTSYAVIIDASSIHVLTKVSIVEHRALGKRCANWEHEHICGHGGDMTCGEHHTRSVLFACTVKVAWSSNTTSLHKNSKFFVEVRQSPGNFREPHVYQRNIGLTFTKHLMHLRDFVRKTLRPSEYMRTHSTGYNVHRE